MRPITYWDGEKTSILYHATTSQGWFIFRLKKIKGKKCQFSVEEPRMRAFYNFNYNHLEVIYNLLTDFFSQYPTNPELDTEVWQDELQTREKL